MNSVCVRCAAFAVLGLAVLALSSSSATSADKDKVTPIKEIMAKAHKGGNSILGSLKTALAKKDDVKWDSVESKVKDLVLLAGDLTKNTPKKGEKESWEKLTTAYEKDAKALLTAAEKKEYDDAKKSLSALSDSCKGCHSVHR
jgi:cytochrome c556